MLKFNKTILLVSLVLFLIVIILLSYVFIANIFSKPLTLELDDGSVMEFDSSLNINKDIILENPTEKDLQSLINKVRSGQDKLNPQE
jgi:hypothetical protein